jgi:ribonuclease R
MAKALRLGPQQTQSLKKSIRKLEAQGVVIKLKKRYFLFPKSGIARGRFSSSPRGFGFVVPEGGYLEDIFVPAKYSGGAYHGDIVEVHYKEKGKKGKPEGRIIRILKKEQKSLLGICRVKSGQAFFIPFGAPAPEEIPLSTAKVCAPLSGDVVKVKREGHHLEEVLGPLDKPGVDIRIVTERYNLVTEFSQESLEEAQQISSGVNSAQRKGRRDFSDWPTLTIDGENAQDFDDAVSIKRMSGGKYLLGVHIADVSHYVRPDSALDREAYRRGTSVYFPDLTLPMLPEKLSNQVCSLRPKEEKLTVTVLMEFDGAGEVLSVDFSPSLIRTAERMTYDSVFKILQGDKSERRKFFSLVDHLLQMKDLARILRAKRIGEGSLDFDLTEPELVYKQGNLFSVISFEANEAHHIIEEFMVAANEAVASFLSAADVPLLFRIHPPPSFSDLERLRELLLHFGVSLPKAEKIIPKDLQSVLEKFKGTAEEKFISLQLLKSLRIAAYSDENSGHYGLAKKNYTHFTSPIRRYPDLVVHRLLKQVLKQEKIRSDRMSSAAEHCSERERAAEEAERDLVEWRIYRFLKQKLGEEFEGVIVDFSRAGLIVALDGYFVEGLVPYSELGGDYFFRESERALAGKATGKTFELGTRIKVVLASVDTILRRMSLALSP